MNLTSRGKDAARKGSNLLSTCPYCPRLSDSEACRQCLDHKQTPGHFPRTVFLGLIPGQPRTVPRFCGGCGTELQVSSYHSVSAGEPHASSSV
jgi:hypothetical protein